MAVFLGAINIRKNRLFTKPELQKWSRLELISWLSRNDPNGIYSDKDSIAEFGSKMTKQEAVDLVLNQQQG
jgi:hypothetical protein